jgi:hypothetical protein
MLSGSLAYRESAFWVLVDIFQNIDQMRDIRLSPVVSTPISTVQQEVEYSKAINLRYSKN